MNRTDEVLDLIDGTLDDPRVSDDAARWTPPGSPLRAAQAERTRLAIVARQQRRLVVPPGYGDSGLAVSHAAEVEQAAERLRRLLEVDPEARERFRVLVADLGQQATRLLDALRPAAEAAGKTIAEVAQEFARAVNAANAGRSASGLVPPALTLRDRDPRAYALQAARTRGTGPVRQAQHEHAPRRLPSRGRIR